MELKNQTALITGGADGLGLSIARALLEEEAKVHVVSRAGQKHREIKKEIQNSNLFTHKSDVSNYSDIEKIVKEIGDVNILINNAGIWLEGNLAENDPEDVSQTIDTNTKGVIFTTKAVLPSMLSNNAGFVLNVSSTSGLKGREKQSVYCASKWAVTGFTEALKDELRDTNIRVAGFYPGGMNTKLFEKAGFPKPNDDWMDTDKVAEIILFILKTDNSMLLDHVVLNKRATKTSS